jgi:hypothetical protein
VKPAKRRRLKLLFQKHPILIARLEEIGLIAPRRDWGAEDDLDARDPWWLDSENEPFADTDFGAERPDSFFTPADEDPRPPENHDFAVPQWPDMDAGRAYANLTSETGSIDWDEYDAFAGG